MGILDWTDIPYEKKSLGTITGTATRLLKCNSKRKKQRRGSGIKKKTEKQKERERVMELYRKQKKERGQMFRDFNRLISED